MASANRDRWFLIGIGLIAAAIGFISARPYAGGWNDGSRLATVECLVDHGTLSIDRSIFVEVPELIPGNPSPYPRDDQLLQRFGTKDKLLIDGRYYSDKSPAPAYYLAAIYRVARSCGMPSAAERPDLFCLLMTWTSSGLAFVIAVVCLFSIARRVGLACGWSALITAFFALGTVALPYAQHVNNHILLLAVALLIFRLLLIAEAAGWTLRRTLALGVFAGIAYTIDLGAGPPLSVLIMGFGCWRARNLKRAWVVVAAAPWIAFHHVINYQLGGSFAPANANPAFFNWPGSPFSEQNMTGAWKHANPFKAVLYAFDMLLGKKGFLGHNLVLVAALFGLPMLLRHRYRERGIVIVGLLWAMGTWLLYSATSNNQSGACCSVRWFVPLLAPGVVALCVLLREHPGFRRDVIVLGIGGIFLGIGMAIRGPWFQRLMPFYWVIYPGTIAMWLTMRWAIRTHLTPAAIDSFVLSARIALAEHCRAESDVVEPNPEAVPANNG